MKKSAGMDVRNQVHEIFKKEKIYSKWITYKRILEMVDSGKIGIYEVTVIGEGFGISRNIVKARLKYLRILSLSDIERSLI